MKNIKTLLLTSIISLTFILCVNAKDESIVTKEFEGINNLVIKTVSGSCKITKHDKQVVIVKLTHKYKPAKNFEPIFEKDGNTLRLRENMKGSNSGTSMWEIFVPENMDIKYNSASGGFVVKNVTGEFEIKTASGNIRAEQVTLMGNSKFSSASGTSSVILASTPKYSLKASSASGNAIVDLNGNAFSGKLEMKCRPDKGEIKCPYSFSDQKEVYNGDQLYVLKSVILEKEEVVVKVYTASGKAILKK